MVSQNPFSFTKSVVTGDLFIGREEQLCTLRQNAAIGKTTCIVGLPRMGKTSLVRQCFFQEGNKKKWLEEYKMIPVYMVVSANSNPISFWKSTATQIILLLKKTNIHLDYLDGLHNLPTADDLYQHIVLAMNEIKDRLGIRLILIYDEFDGALLYPKDMDLFNKLRQLNVYGSIVTCSRRTPSFIEKSITGRSYFTNDADLVFVGLFSEKDVSLYWEHFYKFFIDAPMDSFASYKSLVKQYAGNHPMIMSLMNYELFKIGNNPSFFMDNSQPFTQREPIERRIRSTINEEFNKQIHYVKEQGLLETAIQMVVGSSHKIPENERNLLLDYEFLRVVSNQEKEEIIGYELGPTTADSNHRYICFSALTTHLMKDLFDPDLVGYELLKKTELRLRDLITRSLLMLCDHPFEMKDDGHERWEEVLYNKVYPLLPEDGHDRFLNNLDEMYKVRVKREKNDCKPMYDRTRINMLSSATLGQLWFVFIKWQWIDFFGPILDKNDDSHGNAENWYRRVYLPILNWRNAANHYYDDELSEDVLMRANSLANEVCRNVENWLAIHQQ